MPNPSSPEASIPLPRHPRNAALLGMGFGVVLTCVTYATLFYNVQAVTMIIFMPVLWASFGAQWLLGAEASYENWVAVLSANVLLYAALFTLIARRSLRGIMAAGVLLLISILLSYGVYRFVS